MVFSLERLQSYSHACLPLSLQSISFDNMISLDNKGELTLLCDDKLVIIVPSSKLAKEVNVVGLRIIGYFSSLKGVF